MTYEMIGAALPADISDEERGAILYLLRHCGALKAGERVVVVCNPATSDLGKMAYAMAQEVGALARLFEIQSATVHGQEPPSEVAAAMQSADLILGLSTMSMAHTAARKAASSAGARYLSLPEYSRPLLRDPSLHVNFHAQAPIVRHVADLFTAGSFVRVKSPGGTDLSLDIRDRIGNFCPGFVSDPGTLGSPPDIEANVSPIETASEGIAVIDGSIPYPGLGLLREPVVLNVAQGRIVHFDSADRQVLGRLQTLFGSVGSSNAYVLAELGVGLNPLAKLTGIMLTDEGAEGCLHFGFGSNATVGGRNDVPFHLDFVFHAGSIIIDDKLILENGRLCS